MVTWIVIGTVVLGLIVLVAVTLPVIGRLPALRRAVRGLQQRQQEVQQLQAGAEQLERTLAGVQRRAEITQEGLAVIRAGHGDGTGRHAFLGRR